MPAAGAILLLAAGASSRWGRPKALLDWRGEPLVHHLARVALEAVGAEGRVFRVLGAHADAIRSAPGPAGVEDVFNPDWVRGMGASIACGLRAALALEPALAGVVILPCDQPLVTAAHLRLCLATVLAAPDALVNTDYGDATAGPPAGFGRDCFPALLALDGDEGGRAVLRQHRERVVSLPSPDCRWDLDSAAELHNRKNHLSYA